MRKNDLPDHRLTVRESKGVPFGLRPDWTFIDHCNELPFLPSPSRVVVGRDHFEIDGWCFSNSYVPKGLLIWLQMLVLEWATKDSSDENKHWLHGFMEALEVSFVSNGHFG